MSGSSTTDSYPLPNLPPPPSTHKPLPNSPTPPHSSPLIPGTQSRVERQRSVAGSLPEGPTPDPGTIQAICALTSPPGSDSEQDKVSEAVPRPCCQPLWLWRLSAGCSRLLGWVTCQEFQAAPCPCQGPSGAWGTKPVAALGAKVLPKVLPSPSSSWVLLPQGSHLQSAHQPRGVAARGLSGSWWCSRLADQTFGPTRPLPAQGSFF